MQDRKEWMVKVAISTPIKTGEFPEVPVITDPTQPPRKRIRLKIEKPA
jgi:hypothetical protein